MSAKGPRSCDTFVVLPPGSAGTVIFGKNSDRPDDEVQEVVYVPASDHLCPSKVKCTYMEIDQVPHTVATILSKPSWMWGAEMGANEHGVCIGNEAVWTKLNGPEDAEKKLLGMDLLRLGLERSTTALEALHVITSLLDTYGQGGNCSNTISDFTYHNSFLIADPVEAWVLECAGKHWAAEKITSGVRNISNELSIGTKIDLTSPDLKQHALDGGFWKPFDGSFNFKEVYGLDDDDTESYRYKSGKRLLNMLSASGTFSESDMFKVLRDKPSGICMSSGSFVSTGSQVSVLRTKESGQPCCHWFTATPDPHQSVFKPFIFVDNVEFPMQVVSPFTSASNHSATQDGDYCHELYKLHEQSLKNKKGLEPLRKKKMDLESSFQNIVKNLTVNVESKKSEVRCLFQSAVEEEIKIYC